MSLAALPQYSFLLQLCISGRLCRMWRTTAWHYSARFVTVDVLWFGATILFPIWARCCPSICKPFSWTCPMTSAIPGMTTSHFNATHSNVLWGLILRTSSLEICNLCLYTYNKSFLRLSRRLLTCRVCCGGWIVYFYIDVLCSMTQFTLYFSFLFSLSWNDDPGLSRLLYEPIPGMPLTISVPLSW